MAKSSTKSASKVDTAVSGAQSAKKVKRDPEYAIDEKSAKKQKNELVEQKKIGIQIEKKLEEKIKVSANSVVKNVNVPKKVAVGKNGRIAASEKDESIEESDSDDEMTSDDGTTTREISVVATLPTDSRASDDSYSEDETGSDEEVPKVNTPSVAVIKDVTVSATEKEVESSDGSDSEYETSSGEDVAQNVTAAPSKIDPESVMKNEVAANDESGSEYDSEYDTGSDENVASANKSSPLSKQNNTAALEEKKLNLKNHENILSKIVKPVLEEIKSIEKPESDDENSGSDDEYSGSDGDDADVKMTDAASTKTNSGKGVSLSDKTPDTLSTPTKRADRSTTLFVSNLPFSAKQADVENFFKETGKVVEVRLAMRSNHTFRGFCHVQFSTAEQAVKAWDEMNGKELLGRPLKLDLAREKRSDTPNSREKVVPSFQRGGVSRSNTIFIWGFDKNHDEDQIRSSLGAHFGSCGEFTGIRIPKDREGGVKGIAYIDFKDKNGFNKAVELNGSEFGSGTLTVEGNPESNGGRDWGSRGSGRGSRDGFFGGSFGGHRGHDGYGGLFGSRGRGIGRGGRSNGRGGFGDRVGRGAGGRSNGRGGFGDRRGHGAGGRSKGRGGFGDRRGRGAGRRISARGISGITW